jgi:multiple sugar transport system ATP-binding protein
MAEVALADVTKVYPNGTRALDRFNLSVRDGERVVIVGPSGSGKSTALRLIAGLESVTSGTISIAGRVVNAVSPRDRDVALVFQRPSLYPHLTVRGNLEFGLKLRQHNSWPVRLFHRFFQPALLTEERKLDAERHQRVEDAARLLELTDLLETLPRQLSGGEQQRVALGRALVRRPAVFLFDEPLSNLDPRLRTDLRRELHLLQRRVQATMIYVTHDQTEAMSLGERVVVLDRGVVQQADRPEVLYERPCNRFVAGFIGSPPMNFAAGRLVCLEGRWSFEGGGWSLPLPPALMLDEKAKDGRSVWLGIRPEHIGLSPAGAVTEKLAVDVILVELLGGDTLVTCQRDDWQITARTTARPALTIGQTIEVGFTMARVHLFDAKTGLALTG